MDVDGEQEEEDAGREKKHVKLSVGPVGRGKGRAVSSDGEEESGRASLLLCKGTRKRKQGRWGCYS